MVQKLQMETEKPSTTVNILFQLAPSPMNTTDMKSGPLSLEMFNHATSNLNEKGIINLKKYSKYLSKRPKPV